MWVSEMYDSCSGNERSAVTSQGDKEFQYIPFSSRQQTSVGKSLVRSFHDDEQHIVTKWNALSTYEMNLFPLYFSHLLLVEGFCLPCIFNAIACTTVVSITIGVVVSTEVEIANQHRPKTLPSIAFI
jgi:hypothetical protein